MGLTIECPACGEKPPRSAYGVSHPLYHPFYNYQKWRWLAAHMADHSKALALRHRRIAAAEKRKQEKHAA